jgi:Protein of unknown function (DUF3995)
MSSTRRSWRWGDLACGWALVFAAAHFYWAAGGGLGLDMSAGLALSASRPLWFVLVGLVGVGALLVFGAGVAFLLAHSARRPRLLALLGWAAGLILLLRGAGLEVLMAIGVVHAGEGISGGQITWTWLVWNPWFMLGGFCFTAATVQHGRRTADTRQA